MMSSDAPESKPSDAVEHAQPHAQGPETPVVSARPARRPARGFLKFVVVFAGLMLGWSSLFFTSMYLGLVLVADVLGIVLLGIGAIMFLLSFGPRRDYTWRKVLLAGVLIAGPVRAVDYLQTWEVSVNQTRGARIAAALKQYDLDRGHFPMTLTELSARHMKSVPWCWYGLIPRPYTYSQELSGRPRLEFKQSPTHKQVFDFEYGRWRSVEE